MEYQESNRGQYHFSPRTGWMNDVNGPLYYRGLYHLYFQHNPYGLTWDTMHWGHATSTDLVHWREQPIALDPATHPGDLWSGGGVVDSENVSGLKTGAEDPILVYSGTNGVTVFFSLDGGYTFSSYGDGKKVVQPDGTSRDPKVFRLPDGWGMVVWSDAGGNGVDFWTSRNLLDWTFASRFAGEWLFECPDLVRMPFEGGHRWVLSAASGQYVVGDFDGTEFTTDWSAPERINQTETFAGAPYYAALTFMNLPTERVVSMAWQGQNQGTVWTGNATFPVEQRLRRTADGVRVVSTPIAELAGLRTRTESWREVTVDSRSAPELLADVRGDAYELEMVVRDAERFGFRVAGREVVYQNEQLDGARLRPHDGKLKIQLLVDRGQLEVFGNDGEVYQSWNVPSAGERVELLVDGVPVVESLEIHHLASIW